MLAEMRGDRPLTHDALTKMSVKDTRTLFFAAASQMKNLNRAQTHFGGIGNTTMNDSAGPMTLKQMNERNREFWSKRVN